MTQFVSPDDEHDVLETCRELKTKINTWNCASRWSFTKNRKRKRWDLSFHFSDKTSDLQKHIQIFTPIHNNYRLTQLDFTHDFSISELVDSMT